MSNLLKTDLKLKIVDGAADFAVREGDLEIVSEEDNLAQAIIHRLMTEEGELAELGHPDYGSSLHDLIGRVNNEETRIKARALVLECLSNESRIKDVLNVNVKQNDSDPHRIDIEIAVVPVGKRAPISIFYSLPLEVA